MAINSGNVKDRELQKFVESPTRPGQPAVEVTGNVSLDPSSLSALENITVTVDNAVEITNDAGNPIPVSASSLPLPSGASTLAEQQAQSTKLQEIKDAILGNPPTQMQLLGTDGVTKVDVNSENRLLVSTDNLKVSTLNSTATPLNQAATWTGTWEDATGFNAITVTAKASHNGMLYIDFSPDGSNVDSTLTYNVITAVNEVHRLTVTRRYFRVRFLNNSSYNQTYLRLQTLKGNQNLLTANVNTAVQDDADAILTRSILYAKNPDGEFVPLELDSDNKLPVKLDIKIEALLSQMVMELKLLNRHMRLINDMELEDEEVDN
jgi:hypothetical protein